jgi:hypothetical protein
MIIPRSNKPAHSTSFRLFIKKSPLTCVLDKEGNDLLKIIALNRDLLKTDKIIRLAQYV